MVNFFRKKVIYIMEILEYKIMKQLMVFFIIIILKLNEYLNGIMKIIIQVKNMVKVFIKKKFVFLFKGIWVEGKLQSLCELMMEVKYINDHGEMVNLLKILL